MTNDDQRTGFSQLWPVVNNANMGENLTVRGDLLQPSSLTPPVDIDTPNLTVTTDGSERSINASSSTTEVLNVTASNVTVDSIDKSLTTIKGNVIITGEKHTLQNVTIVGNLILNGADTSTSNVDVTGTTVGSSPAPGVTVQTPSDRNVIINEANSTVDNVSTDGDILINASNATVADLSATNVTVTSNDDNASVSGVDAEESDVGLDADNVDTRAVTVLSGFVHTAPM